MPTQLKVLVGMFAISGLGSAITGHWFFAAYYVAVAILVARGSEGMRTFLRTTSGAGVLLHVGLTVLTILAVATGGISVRPFLALLAFTGFGAASCGFSYWCLGQQEVQHWMYQKSMDRCLAE